MVAITLNERLLEEKLSELEKARNWSPRVISKLEALIRTGGDLALFRLNPIQYAAEKGMQENEALDLFLHATRAGLFQMEWHLVCPFCAHVVESLSELSGVHAHIHCRVCHAEVDLAFDDYIQVAFTISPQVRPIAFHEPSSLPMREYFLNYHFAKGIKSPIPDMSFGDLLQMLTKLAMYLPPTEKVIVEMDPPRTFTHVMDIDNKASLVLFSDDAQRPVADITNIALRVKAGKFDSSDVQPQPLEFQSGPANFKYPQAVAPIANGKFVIEIDNQTDKRGAVLVFQYPPGFEAFYFQFEPFLSGKKLLSHQTFRDLFRNQTIATEEGIAVKDLTYLFTDLKGSTELYDQIGDPKAYYLVRQHFDTLIKVIAQNDGAIVKTIGDAVMATFIAPADALRAGLQMIKELDEFNKSITENLYLKIGIHKGHSIAVTLNERLDYFGQTVNIASRIQGLADANEIYVSEDVYGALGVAEVLSGCNSEPEQTVVKGVSGKLQVYKVTPKT